MCSRERMLNGLVCPDGHAKYRPLFRIVHCHGKGELRRAYSTGSDQHAFRIERCEELVKALALLANQAAPWNLQRIEFDAVGLVVVQAMRGNRRSMNRLLRKINQKERQSVGAFPFSRSGEQ